MHTKNKEIICTAEINLTEKPGKKSNLALIMILYLLGIFMGALDTGIVTPARTVIQNNLLVDEKLGIWVITIYALAYAASIPIMGKLADMYGRKYIYLTSIFLFGLGSLFCGLSQGYGSFTMLLIARVVQAIGGGGIVPVATAEFGTTFPPEKRGMALGMVGMVYGVANIFGASAGSLVLDIFGQNNWQFIFYVNIPITFFILLAGFLVLKNNRSEEVKKIDLLGIFILTIMILSLLYGLKNIDFFDFTNTLRSPDVYPFLIIFIVLMPLFILAEKKAQDPVMNLSYFTNMRILITFFLAFVTGVVMMGMIFVPQFSENALHIQSGSGGYFVIILGLFSGFGAPVSGRLIDKYGPKLILAIGFIISIMGALFLILVAANNPNMITVTISLILIGLGMGFTMGTPLNYMMLENTRPEESNSALAALSLVRSIATVIAPAIMIGFIAHAGTAVQDNVMDQLPNKVAMPTLPYAEELNTTFNDLKKNPMMSSRMEGIDLPDLTSLGDIEITMKKNNDVDVPENLMDQLKASDVTTITDNCKALAKYFFAQKSQELIPDIQSGIQEGIDAVTAAIDDFPPMMAGSPAVTAMQDTADKMIVLRDAIPGAFDTAEENYLTQIEERRSVIEGVFQQTLNGGFKQVFMVVAVASILAMLGLVFYRRETK
ncbi:MFS transporter [Dehalobacter sp. DCM]|uniref:MFS transporter n=1 Tax=Dehalobacter sp. DCM TaxID=2907827 RepID=UPI0030812B2C|nr:MFS transporter [Dehalobacter sp. DCM]